MRRTVTSAPTVYPSTNKFVGSFFASIPNNTPDFEVYTDANSFVGIKASNAGWYMAEIAFSLDNTTAWNYSWTIQPVLWKGTTAQTYPYKYGTSVSYNCWSPSVGPYGFGSDGVQASFIVYLEANETLQAGYDFSAAVTQSAVIRSNRTTDTYFSVALLNRSLA